MLPVAVAMMPTTSTGRCARSVERNQQRAPPKQMEKPHANAVVAAVDRRRAAWQRGAAGAAGAAARTSAASVTRPVSTRALDHRSACASKNARAKTHNAGVGVSRRRIFGGTLQSARLLIGAVLAPAVLYALYYSLSCVMFFDGIDGSGTRAIANPNCGTNGPYNKGSTDAQVWGG